MGFFQKIIKRTQTKKILSIIKEKGYYVSPRYLSVPEGYSTIILDLYLILTFDGKDKLKPVSIDRNGQEWTQYLEFRIILEDLSWNYLDNKGNRNIGHTNLYLYFKRERLPFTEKFRIIRVVSPMGLIEEWGLRDDLVYIDDQVFDYSSIERSSFLILSIE